MGLSLWQILIVVVVIVLLFGRGKISGLMGDVAKGIKSFKKGLSDDDEQQQAIEVQRRLNAEKDKVDTPR
jgi:sec-independent protein translocase protein TatA